MSRTLDYRQDVAQFRKRLNDLISGGGPSQGRIQVDTTGSRTRRVPFRTAEEQLALYGQARHYSVARVLALFEIVRETEQLHARAHPVEVVGVGALWQAYQGTETMNACHTCPCLLELDGQLPTVITGNRGLQRHIIVEFSDCMLLPRAINEIDIVLDELAGKEAFAAAARAVLNNRALGWREGLSRFAEGMRDVLGPFADWMLEGGTEYRVRDAESQQQLERLSAYYTGLYLHAVDDTRMRNFIARVRGEMQVP